jgi:poly-beta-hydroxybutyrate-responsive repressor
LALFLHHTASHGYTLLERLREFGLGDLDNGTVYRALRDMENGGSVISMWDAEKTQGPPRRVYSLTEKGDQMLRAWVQDLYQARDQINYFLAAYERHMIEDVGAYHDH